MARPSKGHQLRGWNHVTQRWNRVGQRILLRPKDTLELQRP